MILIMKIWLAQALKRFFIRVCFLFFVYLLIILFLAHNNNLKSTTRINNSVLIENDCERFLSNTLIVEGFPTFFNKFQVKFFFFCFCIKKLFYF